MDVEEKIIPENVEEEKKIRLDLPKEAERARRYSAKFSVLLINIDGFKDINNKLGVKGGNFVLKEIASIIRQNIRKIDIMGRWDVDDFIILTVDMNPYGPVALGEKIRSIVANHPFKYNDLDVRITVSIGISRGVPETAEEIDKIIERARKCLLRAKSRGRNCVEFWSNEKNGLPSTQ